MLTNPFGLPVPASNAGPPLVEFIVWASGVPAPK
jgi:hypothetical protein